MITKNAGSSQELKSGNTGRDHYAGLFRDSLDFEAEWLRRGAVQKVDSIEQLLNRQQIRPNTILELGCGTGAVLLEMQRRNLAVKLYGADYSEDAINHLKTVSEGIELAVADITANARPFDVDHYDVVVLSHVVEHLEEPLAFLRHAAAINSDYFIIEVPLEDLLFGKIKAKLKDRSNNPAGHVQFFTPQSFRELISTAGFIIEDERIYAPQFDRDTIRFAYGSNRRSYYWKMLSEHLFPRYLSPVWKRLYHAHHAILCRRVEG